MKRPPRLEDFLTGTPREAEISVSDFRQYDPKDGAPITQPTTAFISFDDKNLYVGWICKDDPAQIRAHMMKRDQLLSDDRVSISLDTFHDHHRSYWFDANPYGIQMDGMTIDGVDDFNFDTLWYSEARLTSDGYVALEIIPFKSLRFPRAPVQEWGFVVNRMITRNNEMSCWPYITRRITGWSSQFGHMEGMEEISQGRNLQLIPYGLFSGARFLDTLAADGPAFKTESESRIGLDSKMILKDAFTLDLTLNPDFSQVESDEPQVTINQRYEVFFPEKRPFFIENANLFQTPENLFFSRRIVDPQFGARLSGKLGRWALGVLAADDQAPGRMVNEADPDYGRRAAIGIFRLLREFGRENRIGFLATSRDFSASSNRVFAADTRLQLNPNWVFTGQWMGSETRQLDGKHLSGPAYLAKLSHFGKHFSNTTTYTDRSPGFRSDSGFIPRVDVRQVDQTIGYRWRPEKLSVVSFGPNLSSQIVWDHQGVLTDWELEPEFDLELTRMTQLHVEQSESFELFEGIRFRKQHTRFSIASEPRRWLGLSTGWSLGTNINYYPVPGLAPFLADSSNGTLGLILRPSSQLVLENSYIYSRLRTDGDGLSSEGAGSSIFNNHILRTKGNYQFNREFSLRCIFDYNGVLPNVSLVSLERAKRLGADVLLTYMLHPGTALHIGYTDLYENLALDPTQSPALHRTAAPDTSVGRQFFIKMSYLLRM